MQDRSLPASGEEGWRYALRQLKIANWLVEHGTLLDVADGESKQRPFLDLTSRFADHLSHLSRFRGEEEVRPLYKFVIELFGCEKLGPLFPLMFNPQLQDACQCFCSSGGCSGVSVYVRDWKSWRRTAKVQLLPFEVLSAQLSSSPELWSPLSTDIIRALTFSFLRMKHTCCKLRRDQNGYNRLRPMDKDEINEIHEEGAESIRRLEKLMPELIHSYDTSDFALLEYLSGPYMDRMGEVLAEQDGPLESSNILAIEQLVVRLHPSEDVDDQCEEYYDDEMSELG